MRHSAENIFYGPASFEEHLSPELKDSKEGRKEIRKLLAALSLGEEAPLRRAALNAADLHAPLWQEIWGQVVYCSLLSQGVPLPAIKREELIVIYHLWPEPEMMCGKREAYWPVDDIQKISLLQDMSPLGEEMRKWFVSNRRLTALSEKSATLLVSTAPSLAEQMIASSLAEMILPTLEIFCPRPTLPYLRIDDTVHLLSEQKDPHFVGDGRTFCGEDVSYRRIASASYALWALAPYRGLRRCTTCAKEGVSLQKLEEEEPHRPYGLISNEGVEAIASSAKTLLRRLQSSTSAYHLQLDQEATELIVQELDRLSGESHPLQMLLREADINREGLTAEKIKALSIQQKAVVINTLHSSPLLHAEERARRVLLSAAGRSLFE